MFVDQQQKLIDIFNGMMLNNINEVRKQVEALEWWSISESLLWLWDDRTKVTTSNGLKDENNRGYTKDFAWKIGQNEATH